jgi:hypothetical protein
MTEPDDGRQITIHVGGDMTPQWMYAATSMVEAICVLGTCSDRIIDYNLDPQLFDLSLLDQIDTLTHAIRRATRDGQDAGYKPSKASRSIISLAELNYAVARASNRLGRAARDPLVSFEWLQTTSSFNLGISVDVPAVDTVRDNLGKTGRDRRKEEVRHLQTSNLQNEQEREIDITDKRLKMIRKTLNGWVEDGIITKELRREIWIAILSGQLASDDAASWLGLTLVQGTPPPQLGPAGD